MTRPTSWRLTDNGPNFQRIPCFLGTKFERISTLSASSQAKMASNLKPYPPGSTPSFEEASEAPWTPLFQQRCSFPPEIFRQVMLNLIRNPNINSNHLFRADISLESPMTDVPVSHTKIPPRLTYVNGYDLKTVIVRTMIPRNILLDRPLDQTCLFHEKVTDSGEVKSLVTYLPHISSAKESPFYHPAVRSIGFLHSFNPGSQEGSVSIHYSFFDSEPRSAKLERTALHLLTVLLKHGKGSAAGYVKRVNHDVIITQAVFQNTYARLKAKYARGLIKGWVESTDPSKHVFEDLGIAAFLIELWVEMYKDSEYPGFVDIGCGNGLLVHILLEEGYRGWGFDARKRKSWDTYSPKAQENLKELVLMPYILQKRANAADLDSNTTPSPADLSSKLPELPTKVPTDKGISSDIGTNKKMNQPSPAAAIHSGKFPKGTFIISNHADELTPWTPILANLSESPFMMIPCCSHALSGAKFRAPRPKGAKSSGSAYASLVVWVSKIAKDCGWVIEKEMLRIPSTRNTALIGRHREKPFKDVNMEELLMLNGGADTWEENALKLVKGAAHSH